MYRRILIPLEHSSYDRVIIDHVEEHTAPLVLDSGFWAGITLYPESKSSPARERVMNRPAPSSAISPMRIATLARLREEGAGLID